MKFFCLEAPVLGSDYEYTRINGSAVARYRLPWGLCQTCGKKSGFPFFVLPYQLPPELASDPRFQDRRPIPEAERRALLAEVEEALRRADPEFGTLPAGADFPPITWRVPSRPDGDFFWASLKGPIVSARIAEALRTSDATGCALIPVEEVRAGRRPADEDLPRPESGEPEDLLAWATEAVDDPRFYFLSVPAEGNPSSRMLRRETCATCGRVETIRESGWDAWEDAIWPGEDIFRFPTTRGIVVTEEIANLLIELAASNVDIKLWDERRRNPRVDRFFETYERG